MTVASVDTHWSDADYLLRLLCCLATLLALRLVALYTAKTDLVLDEAQYWTWSRELAFGYFSKPPMIAWVIRGISDLGIERVPLVDRKSRLLHFCRLADYNRAGE